MNPKKIKSILPAVILFTAFGVSSCSARTENVNINVSNSANASSPSNTNAENVSAEPSAGGAAQTAAPDALVKDLYKTHDEEFKTSKFRILSGKNRTLLDKYFDKTLADLIWKDLTTHKGEVGVLDFDPFYNAQDAEIKNLVVSQPKTSDDKATVTVTFQNYDRKETLNYQLTRRDADWKISDIKYTDGNSLLGYFKEDAKNNAKTNQTEENFFSGTYKVGDTTCTVKPIKMAFEVKWAKGTGTMIFVFDGDADAGNYTYSSEDGGKGKDTFIFDDDTFTTGKFIRADGKEFPVSKVK